jgi:hypothetical protein
MFNFFQQHPDQTSFPNTAFFLVASDNTNPNRGRILWADYVFNNNQIRPQETWSADLARPVEGNSATVVLCKSISWNVELRVYNVGLDQNLGVFPVQLEPTAYQQWPKAAPATSVYKTDLLGQDISGIAEIHVVTEGSGVTIHGIRDLASTPPVDFHFDTRGKQWSRPTGHAAENKRPG